VLHDIRDITDPDDGAPLLAELTDELTVGRDDAERDLGLVVGEGVERGERRPEQRQDERAEERPDDGEPQDDRPRIEEPAF
jgi:hypothetical protein